MSLPSTSEVVADALQRLADARRTYKGESEAADHVEAVAQAIFPPWRKRPKPGADPSNTLVAEVFYELAKAERAYSARLRESHGADWTDDERRKNYLLVRDTRERVVNLALVLCPERPAPAKRTRTKAKQA